MTPETLHAYLSKRFKEDVVQEVILLYLLSSKVIRYPKAWAWRVAVHQTRRFGGDGRGPSPTCSQVNINPQELSPNLVSLPPDPLHHAETREALSRAMSQGPKPGDRRKVRWQGWREDYAVLQCERE